MNITGNLAIEFQIRLRKALPYSSNSDHHFVRRSSFDSMECRVDFIGSTLFIIAELDILAKIMSNRCDAPVLISRLNTAWHHAVYKRN